MTWDLGRLTKACWSPGALELWSKSTKLGDGAEQNGNLQQGGERPSQGALCPFIPKGSETD